MKLEIKLPQVDRFKSIYGIFNIILRVNSYEVRVGRGSLSALGALRFYPRLASNDPVLAEIGNFCEFSDSKIVLGGEHPSNRPIHVTFGASYEILLTNDHPIFMPSTNGRIKIGSCTVVGVDATILSGTEIGDNCSVAAGSVVRGIFEDNSVIGGVPSRVLKSRLQQSDYLQLKNQPWWEASHDWIVNCISDIQNRVRPRFQFQSNPYNQIFLVFEPILDNGRITRLVLTGWESNNKFFDKSQMPPQFIKYINQLNSSESIIIDTQIQKHLL